MPDLEAARINHKVSLPVSIAEENPQAGVDASAVKRAQTPQVLPSPDRVTGQVGKTFGVTVSQRVEVSLSPDTSLVVSPKVGKIPSGETAADPDVSSAMKIGPPERVAQGDSGRVVTAPGGPRAVPQAEVSVVDGGSALQIRRADLTSGGAGIQQRHTVDGAIKVAEPTIGASSVGKDTVVFRAEMPVAETGDKKIDVTHDAITTPTGGTTTANKDDGDNPSEGRHLNSMRDLQGPPGNRVEIPIRRVVHDGLEAVRYTDVNLSVDTVGRTGEAMYEEATAKWIALKPERAELSGIFIERIGPYVGEVRGELVAMGHDMGWDVKSGVGKYVGPFAERTLLPLDPHEKYTKEQLKSAMMQTFKEASSRWEAETDARVAGLVQDQLSLEEQKYVRFQDIIEFGKQWYMTGHANLAGFMDTGNGMAVGTMWDLFDVAERLFEDAHKRPIKEKEADMIYASTLPLSVQLAAGNVGLIIPLNKFLRSHGLNSPGIAFPFSKEYFTFVQRPGKRMPELAVTQEALQEFEKRMESDPKHVGEIEQPPTVTTMCPALAVDDSGNYFPVPEDADPRVMDVVKATHEWSRAVAREYYIPHHFAAA